MFGSIIPDMSREIAKIREADLKMVELYKDFLPERIFDAHVHMYAGGTVPSFYGPAGNFFREEVFPQDYCDDLLSILPGVREVRLNMMPMPDSAFNDPDLKLRDRANSHIAKLVSAQPQHVGSAYVMGNDSEEKIRDMVSKPGIRALKCYYTTPKGQIDPNAAPRDFIPEAAWAVANEKGLPIILHLMRPTGLSDPENFSYVMDMTAEYPNAQLVLAHCARGFAAWTAVEQIRKILHRDNIWFDLAAICEAGPIMAAIIQNAGKRVLWGTDWPICLHRGRAVSVGLGQQWLAETARQPTDYALLAVESLYAFHQAARLLSLDQTQVNDIFYRNAEHFFGQN